MNKGAGVLWVFLIFGLGLVQTVLSANPEPGALIFDTSRVARINLTISESNYNTMVLYIDHLFSEDHPYVSADFEFDGQVMTNVGVRIKGNSSLIYNSNQPSLKIDFDRYREGGAFDGLKKLNLHNQPRGGSPLADFLSYGAWRDFGVPAPRTGWAEVMINGTSRGTYTTVEQINQGFISRHFDFNKGDLYKPEHPAGTLEWRGPNISNYTNINPELQDGSDHAALLNMIDVINHQPVAAFSNVMDLKGVLTYLAGNVALGNWDAYTRMAHNYYLYENASNKFTLLPWDMNFSHQGNGNSIMPPEPGPVAPRPLSDKLLADPTYKQLYLSVLKAFLEGPGSKEVLIARADEAIRLGTNVIQTRDALSLKRTITNHVDRLRVLLQDALTNSPTPRILINELMASNTRTATDEAGEFEDWIELYNPNSEPINLSGMFLSDNPKNSRKWSFPTNTIIHPKGYLRLWADEDQHQGSLHLNFKLSSDGETLALYDNDARAHLLIDSRTFGPQTADVSEGRLPDGNRMWISQLRPTPGMINDTTDSDGDGLPDVWEQHHGLNKDSNADADLDADHDGASNRQEFTVATDPRDAGSVFRLTLLNIKSNWVQLNWTGESGRNYQVQMTTNLTSGQWQALGLPTRAGNYADFKYQFHHSQIFRVQEVD